MLPETIVPTNGDTESRNPIYRLVTRWSQLNLPLKLATMIMFLGLSATGLYFALAQNGRIAFIDNFFSSGPTPVTPPVSPPYSPTPYPTPSATTAPNCVSGVYSAEISHACSTQGFYNVKYQCVNGRTVIIGDGKTCIDIFNAGNQARERCGMVCTVPTPRACRQEYGSCFTKQNTCLSYTDSCAKEDFCLFPIQVCASPSPSIRPSPTPTRSPKPSVTCLPRPSCPANKPACLLPQSDRYCPSPTPLPTPTLTPKPSPTPTPIPPKCLTFKFFPWRYCNGHWVR